MTKYNGDDLLSFQKLADSTLNQVYPNNQIVVKNTSYSTEGVSSRTLSSRTLMDVAVGNVRGSQKFELLTYVGALDSSLNSTISSAYTSSLQTVTRNDEEVSLGPVTADPNSFDTRSENISTLTGSAAFNEVFKNSIASRAIAGNQLQGAARAIQNAMLSPGSANENDSQAISIDGNIHTQESVVNTAREMAFYGASGTTVALVSRMSEEQLGWHKDRLRILNERGIIDDDQYLVNGFPFDLDDSLTGLKQTNSTVLGQDSRLDVEQDIVGLSYTEIGLMAPALVELLIYLSGSDSSINITCHAGFNGTIQGNELGETVSSNSFVSDHFFGRSVDILSISSTTEASARTINLNSSTGGSSVTDFREALELFLTELNTIGMSHPYLIPDVITIHPDLAQEYEVANDLSIGSQVNSTMRQRFPGLQYVDFSFGLNSNTAHRNHIHIAFSSARSGIYSGPGILLLSNVGSTIEANPSSEESGSLIIIDGEVIGDTSDVYLNPKYITSYDSSTSISLTAIDVFNLLRGTIMSDEAAAIFTAICERESNFEAWALNPAAVASGGSSGPAPETGVPGQNLVNKAYEVVAEQIRRQELFNDPEYTVYSKQGMGPDKVTNPVTDTNLLWDCSNFVYWVAHHCGLYYKWDTARQTWVQTSNEQEALASNLSNDWSQTAKISKLMRDNGTLFVKDDGTPDFERAYITPGAILLKPNGHVAFTTGTVEQNDPRRRPTQVHSTSRINGAVVNAITQEYYIGFYQECGFLPGTVEGPASDTQSGIPSNARVRGDWSIGLWQTNFLAHGEKTFTIYNPFEQTFYETVGWKMALSNWNSSGIFDFNSFKIQAAVLYDSYKKNVPGFTEQYFRMLVHPDMRRPINQALGLYTTITGNKAPSVFSEEMKLARDPSSGYIFGAWGDYNGGPPYGWISSLDFATAVRVYESATGKSRTVLRDWVLDMFAASDSSSAQYAENWVNGFYYGAAWGTGWTAEEPYRKTIIDY